jgi:hypothetical protein
MQPLDLAFMGPLKCYCVQEVERWLRAHPGHVVNIYQVGELYGNPYMRASTAENAASGFRKAGLYTCNTSIIRSHEFLFAEKDSEQASVKASKEPQPGISCDQAIDIFPLPTFCEKCQKTYPCAGSAQVITSSPYKNLVKGAKKKKPVNKKVFQSRSL